MIETDFCGANEKCHRMNSLTFRKLPNFSLSWTITRNYIAQKANEGLSKRFGQFWHLENVSVIVEICVTIARSLSVLVIVTLNAKWFFKWFWALKAFERGLKASSMLSLDYLTSFTWLSVTFKTSPWLSFLKLLRESFQYFLESFWSFCLSL